MNALINNVAIALTSISALVVTIFVCSAIKEIKKRRSEEKSIEYQIKKKISELELLKNKMNELQKELDEEIEQFEGQGKEINKECSKLIKKYKQ